MSDIVNRSGMMIVVDPVNWDVYDTDKESWGGMSDVGVRALGDALSRSDPTSFLARADAIAAIGGFGEINFVSSEVVPAGCSSVTFKSNSGVTVNIFRNKEGN